MRILFLACLVLAAAGCATMPPAAGPAATPQLTLAPNFSDHMVVQRESPVRVWGKADPGVAIKLSLADSSARVKADADGRWQAELREVPAGGPYTLRVESGATVRELTDILCGDVWLCSGQSNMQWPLFSGGMGARDGEAEVAAANYPQIRLIQIARKPKMTPQEEVITDGWEVCSPDTIGDFSAVGYFFGRELYQHLDVPIGLISSNYGGTMVEAWTSDEGLRTVPQFAGLLDDLQAHPEKIQALENTYNQQLDAWMAKLNEADAGFDKWNAESVDTAEWETMSLPGNWEEKGHPDLDGVAWYRKDVELPQGWSGRQLRVKLGNVNDRIQLYFNGQEVLHWAHNAQMQSGMEIPAGLAKAGKNTIVARIFDTGGPGGLYGAASNYFVEPAGRSEEAIPLDGDWKFHVGVQVQKFDPLPSVQQWHPESPNGASRLYNGMIAPLVRLPIKGAIWYQGESNASRAAQYGQAFPAMINDWRKQWGQPGLPFLFVQLANYKERQPEPVDDAWAELRDAQLQTLQLPKTGMAVIIDIGEADNIHPKNKQDVGKRLALAARHVAYGEDLVYSGPAFESWQAEGNKARVRFTQVGGGLVAQGGALKGFAVAGEDRKFHWADANIEGDSVLVASPEVSQPLAVRYGWGTNPEVNLYNAEGLPASPFRTDDWPLSTADETLKLPE